MTGDIYFERLARPSVVRLEEDIAHGQAVHGYTVHRSDGGPWQELSKGTTIGYAKVDRIGSASAAAVRRLRVVVEETVAPIQRLTIKVYEGGSGETGRRRNARTPDSASAAVSSVVATGRRTKGSEGITADLPADDWIPPPRAGRL